MTPGPETRVTLLPLFIFEIDPRTPLQIEAVKSSWSKVAPIADQASVLFYERLFT
jgi:hypothetical protein